MGKIKQGILGGVSGKVGGVIGTSWKGIAVLRTTPLSVANPRTNGQVVQRAKMKLNATVASSILAEIVKPLWDRFAVKMSGYNAFVQANQAAFPGADLVDLAKYVISKGKMAPVANVTATWHAGTEGLSVAWDATLPDAYSAATDKIYILIMDKTGGIYGTSSGVATRADQSVDFNLADMSFVPADARAFVAAIRADGTIVSNSVSVVPIV